MDWTETILRLLPCLLIAGLLGGLIGWMLGRIFGSANATELLNNCQANLSSRDLELGGLRTDLAASTSRYASLQTELATLATTLKTREIWIGEHEEKIKALELDLDARISELDELKAESVKQEADLKAELESNAAAKAEAYNLRTKLSEVEVTAKTAKAAEGELATLKTAYAEKEQDYAKMSFRLKNLESLPAQLKEKDDQLASLSASHATALDGKQSEILRLGVEIAAIGGLTAKINSQGNRIKELEAQLHSASSSSEAQAGELGKLRDQLVASGNSINGLEKELVLAQTAGGDKNAEIVKLQTQIGDLEALGSQLKDRDSEIAQLRLRVAELEPVIQEVKNRDVRLFETDGELVTLRKRLVELEKQAATGTEKVKSLEADYESAIGAKDSEIAGLALQIGEMAVISGQLKERDHRIKELDEKLQASVSAKDAEIGQLNLRITQLSSLPTQLTERDGELIALRKRLVELENGSNAGDEKVKNLEASYRSMMSNKDSEIARLNLRIGEIATLSGQLNDRDGELVAMRKRLVELEKSGSQASTDEVEIKQLRARLSELDTLTKSLQERDAKLVEWDQRYNSSISERDRELSKLRARITELEMMSREVKERPKVERAKKSSQGGGTEKDDLKLIFGIGPVFERLLNEQGIYFFRDIATWGENEIRHYDDLLEEFSGRIERDDWVSGAKEEHLKKYGEALQ